MKDLKDLLRHEVLDLRSAEDQLIEGMPAMIEKATNPQLKKALREHLRVTEGQRKRIDKVIDLLGDETGENVSKVGNFFSGIFGGGDPKCKAMEGIIAEGNKMMAEDMNEEVMDAAIISCSQKMEHYEICGYGTVRAFARELQLPEVEALLKQTLDEEYEADNILTRMAVGGGINQEAEQASGSESGSGRGGSNKASSGKKAAASRSTGVKKSSLNKASSGKKSSSGSSSSAKKSSSGSSSSNKSTGNKSSSGAGSSGKKTSSGGSSSGKKSSAGKKGSGGTSGSSGSGNRGGKASSGNQGGSKSSSGSKGASGSKSSAGKKGASGGKKSSAKAGALRRR